MIMCAGCFMVNKKVYKSSRVNRVKNNVQMVRLGKQLKSIIPPKVNYATKPKRRSGAYMDKEGLSFAHGLVDKVVGYKKTIDDIKKHEETYVGKKFKKGGKVYHKARDTVGYVTKHPLVNKAVEGFDTALAAGGPLGAVGLALGGGGSIVKGVGKIASGLGGVVTGRGGDEYNNYIPTGPGSGVRNYR
jgi:hypothetical protein